MRASLRNRLLLCTMLPVLMASEQAAARPVTFDIPAITIGQALVTFGLQSGAQVTLADPSLATMHASAVRGTMEPRVALEHMAGHDGLVVEPGPAGVLVLRAAHPASGKASSATSSGVENIAVSAQRRRQPMQDVPVTVDAFSSKRMSQGNITSLQSLTALEPSLVIGEGTGQAMPFLRGVGNPERNVGNEASTSIYVDDVYYARLPAAFFQLNDVSQVEVLKGPQGTLFGRNSEGGLVQIITRTPTQTPHVNASFGYGNYNTTKTTLYASGGLNDRLAGDIAFLNIGQGQGWGKDIVTGGKNGFEEVTGGHAKIVAKPTDTTQITLGGDYLATRSTSGLSSNAYEGTYQGYPDQPYGRLSPVPFYDTRNDVNNVVSEKGGGIAGKIEQTLPYVKLTSITAYRNTNEMIRQDGDDTPRPAVVAVPRDTVKQVSEEFQIASRNLKYFDFIAGFYYLDLWGGYNPVTEYGTKFGNNTYRIFANSDDLSYAGYTQATVHLPARTNLTLGYRYTSDDVSASGHTDVQSPTSYIAGHLLSAEKNFGRSTWKASIDHHFTNNLMTYVSYSTGFKAGVFNTLPLSTTPINPETMKAYEIGTKSEFFRHRLQVNLSLFYYDIANPQVLASEPGLTIKSLLVNAHRAHSKGVDLSTQAVLLPNLTQFFSISLLDARYDSFPNAPTYSPNPVAPYGNGGPGSINADGKYMPRAPVVSFSIGYNYRIDSRIGEFNLNANYNYNTGYYWDPDNAHRQRAYGLLDTTITYQPNFTPRWNLQLWGKNLTDVQYYWGENETAGPSGVTSVVAPPRTFGFNLSYSL